MVVRSAMPLVMMMVRGVDVMVLMMLMVLPRVGALWVVVLRVVGFVSVDAGGEGVVRDAPGDVDAAGVAGDALVYGVAGNAEGEGGVGRGPFCDAAGDDDGEGGGCDGVVDADGAAQGGGHLDGGAPGGWRCRW